MHRSRTKQALAGLAALAALATPALANTGSSAWMATLLHLLFGNFIIGVVEGLLLVLLVRARFIPAIAWMVVANYLSAWLGWSAGLIVRSQIAPEEVFRLAWTVTLLFTAFGFVASILIEWVFCWLSIRTSPTRLVRSIIGAIAVNAISYPLMIWIVYSGTSFASLYTRLDHVRDPSFVREEMGDDLPWVYYATLDKSMVRRIRLDGTVDELVREIPPIARGWGYFSVVAVPKPGGVDLWCGTDLEIAEPDQSEPRWRVRGGEGGAFLIGSAHTATVQPWRLGLLHGDESKQVPMVGIAPEHARFDVEQSYYFTSEGLLVSERSSGKAERFAFDNALFAGDLNLTDVSYLPEDLLVLQAGRHFGENHDTVVVLSLRSRRIAPLVPGLSPVVVFGPLEPPAEQSEPETQPEPAIP